MRKEFDFSCAVEHAAFEVREDHTLCARLQTRNCTRTLVFHDFIKREGKRFFLFHPKTEISVKGNQAILRTAAVCAEDGAPIPGLYITYTFTFDEKEPVFYLSVNYGSDVRMSGCAARLLDVSWEDLNVHSYTGYEYNAEGVSFSHTFRMPEEKNPLAPDYEMLMTVRPHVAWERMVTRPKTFQRAVAVHGENGYFAVVGGTPTFHAEAEYISVFTNFPAYNGDLRFYSGENAPGAWFVLEERDDFAQLMNALEQRIPVAAEHDMVRLLKKRLPVCAGALNFELLIGKSGVWTTPICYKENVAAQPFPLFAIELYDTKYENTLSLDSGYGWDRVQVLEKERYFRISLSDPENGEISGISVVLEGFPEPQAHRVSWNVRVVNRSDRWSVTEITYPQCLLHGFETGFGAVGSGVLLKYFNRRCETFRGKYPTGVKVNMPYFAMYGEEKMTARRSFLNGVYFGIHDSEGNPRFLNMAGTAASDSTLLYAECTPDYPRHPGNSFTLPGTMVWQRFGGDWFDATEIYRSFVHRSARWLSPLRGRSDSPEWIRHCPVWIMHFMPNENPDANPFPITLRERNPDASPEDWYRTAIRFRKEIGVPVTYHLYNWHWVPFNNDNPHYFPTHHDLKKGMGELKNADIRVIPYIAGYSWDMCDRRGGDYLFQREAAPATAKTRTEALYIPPMQAQSPQAHTFGLPECVPPQRSGKTACATLSAVFIRISIWTAFTWTLFPPPMSSAATNPICTRPASAPSGGRPMPN